MAEPIETIKAERRLLRYDITRSRKRIDNEEFSSLSFEQLDVLNNRFANLQENIKYADKEILTDLIQKNATEAELQLEYDSCVTYSTKILEGFSAIKSRLNSNQHAISQSNLGTAPSTDCGPAKLRLPQVSLPTYSNKEGENLQKFFMNFENIINKYNLSDYEKFIYLQGQLTGEPLTLIKSLDISSQSFAAAKGLLTRAFASKVTQQFQAIKSLADLKFSPKLPYEFVGKMRQIQEAFTSLSITADIMLQYFFWHAMPENLQNHFIAISNSNRPTLADIERITFEAMERYIDSSRTSKTTEKLPDVNNYAVSLEKYKAKESNPKQFCSLCSVDGNKIHSHSTYNCQVFPTPEKKLEKLNERKGCVKCGNTTHPTNLCRFKFKQSCKNCSKWHFTYLCPGKPELKSNANSNKVHKQPADRPKPDRNISSTCIWVAESTLDSTGHDTIMPTFTCSVNNHEVRVLRDSGCQASFITSALADRLNLKTVNSDFSLNIHGFNSSNRLQTKIVEFQVNYNEPPINLICVPEIRTKMHLPGLSAIVNSFIAKGYELADKLLAQGGDCIDNIDIVIGDNESQIIPQTDIVFGPPPCSMYAQTSRGVLLMGSIDRLMTNLEHLPILPANNETSALSCVHDESTCTKPPIFLNSSEQSFEVINKGGKIDETVLAQALNAAMREQFDQVLTYDNEEYEDHVVEVDKNLVQHVLEKTSRSPDGRLCMPLMWNGDASDQLPNNFALAKAILKSNFKKLKKSKDKLSLYDQVIKEQEELGVVERVTDIKSFMEEHPTCSFIPHMGVFKMSNDSTKCRIVYLSNLVDRRLNSKAVSHNQAILSGPCLNRKISTTLCDWRFDKFIITFDVIKAFLNIELYPEDQEKLILLWYKDIENENYELQAFKHVRLAFGLRCSPAILMLAMYIMLISNSDTDSPELKQLKTLIYALIYVDNGAYTTNEESNLIWAYEKLNSIFNPFQFYIQQHRTNLQSLQARIDSNGEATPNSVKYFGLLWHRDRDTISTQPLQLDAAANTKRTILSSIAANYDILQLNGPILNRARIFMHALQCDNTLSWDEPLVDSQACEWANIAKQVNRSKPLEVPRYIGRRDGQFDLVACTDASQKMYGVTLYLRDLSCNKMFLLAAKNRIVNKQLETKSIPSLEFQALTLGVEVLHDYYTELAGANSVSPININSLLLLSDSVVALNWLNNAHHKMDKMQKISVFIKNRLQKVIQSCIDKKPIEFRFTAGSDNPADCITRCLSYQQLLKTNFFSGPNLLDNEHLPPMLNFTIPGSSLNLTAMTSSTELVGSDPLIEVGRFSSFEKSLKVSQLVLSFVNKLKAKVNVRYGRTNAIQDDETINHNAWIYLISQDQKLRFPEIFQFFKNPSGNKIPNLITQLNLYLDADNILRVRSKFDRWSEHSKFRHPILLAKESELTSLIIDSCHRKKLHSGCYSVLNELRREFYIPNHFSVVKRVLKKCTHCRRVNSRTILTNQNSYRSFRIDPPSIPFRSIFIDHFGPYHVKLDGKRMKVWVLCICCLWSRAINLKLCLDLTAGKFLMALQEHIFEYGTPELCLSDMGSSLVAGGNIIRNCLNDSAVTSYLRDNNIKPMSFTHYSKGCHQLGGLVESCVKISKRLIYGAIRTQVLDIFDFKFLLAQTVCIANKRPIALKEALRDGLSTDVLPAPITPEVLLKGHDLVTLNIVPSQPTEIDPEWTPVSDRDAHIRHSYNALNTNRQRLGEIYREEFMADLTRQATNIPDRFKPVKHEPLEINDLVLLKEDLCKSVNFPMGIVREVVKNSIGEVTDVIVMKGNREKVRRHVSSVILLLRNEQSSTIDSVKDSSPNSSVVASIKDSSPNNSVVAPTRLTRKSARKCRDKIAAWVNDDQV